MAVTIIFEIEKLATEMATPIHEALKGWDAYVDSTVLLRVSPSEGLITLVIGPDNDNDVVLRAGKLEYDKTDKNYFEHMYNIANLVTQNERVDKLFNYLDECFILPKSETKTTDSVYDIEGNQITTYIHTLPADVVKEDPDNHE